ncbi:MAG: RNA polymerase sigma factor [Pseudomonadota bacterium]|jgi:RNA polymerase sigma-70 factor (ECF subfamily)
MDAKQAGTGAVSGNAAIQRPLTSGRSAFLRFLVKRLGNRADAEDVLQEFCIRVLTRHEQLRNAERLDAWLYAVLRSTLNDHFRKAGRRRRLDEAFAQEMAAVGDAVDAPEAMDLVCGCIRGLVPGLRPADADLIRRIDLGLADHAAVAADLGIRPGTLAVRLHRARKALRDLLVGHCGPCCQHGFDDCSCMPGGCENVEHQTRCDDVDAT